MDDVDFPVPAPIEPILAKAQTKLDVPLRYDLYDMLEP